VAAYDPAEWTDLFVAMAGASAALAGLVFVAVSINVERILQYAGLPERALQTLLLLLSVLIVSVVGLIPGQDTTAVGVELLVCGLVFAIVIWSRGVRSTDPALRGAIAPDRLTLLVLGTVPFVIGAVSLLLDAGGGLYWIVAGIVFATCGAVANAWVLLVEIRR
jgi:modulator of FtsH protease